MEEGRICTRGVGVVGGAKARQGFCKIDGARSGRCAAGCNNHGQNLASKEVRVARKQRRKNGEKVREGSKDGYAWSGEMGAREERVKGCERGMKGGEPARKQALPHPHRFCR